jgi:hypothetical protein
MVTNRIRQRKPPPPVSGTYRWALQPTATHPGVLVLNNDTAYLVVEHLDGLARLGFQLRKADGKVYDLDTTQDPWTCDCPDYLFRRAYRDPKGCKHIAGLRKALHDLGMLE